MPSGLSATDIAAITAAVRAMPPMTEEQLLGVEAVAAALALRRMRDRTKHRTSG
jgi:hypothetical protein